MNPSNGALLSTKLKMPAPRRDYVVRAALFEQLSRCGDMSVVFVRGGAGTGKTTLLSSFIRETGLKKTGWLSLDESNSNIYSFWYYFAAAADSLLGGTGEITELLRANYDASHMEGLLTILINAFCSPDALCGGEDYYIVLDDMHCVRDGTLLSTLEFFIKSMPENLHIFMLSREDPPVYLGALAVSGRLLFIDGRQMQLTHEEGLAFLRGTLKLNKSDEEIAKLNEYAEGWIGGLQLAAAAASAGAAATGIGTGTLLRAGGGIAAEYLTREIFEALSQSERDFLVATGCLSYFDADVCDKILDGLEKSEFDGLIERLIQKNLFIVCIDEQKCIYRYHNILSEYLKQQFLKLPAGRVSELLHKSSAAFEERGDTDEALRLLAQAGDYKEMMRIARSMTGGIEMWSYLNNIPADLLIDDPDLAAQCFMYNMGRIDIERCRILFEKFKERYDGTDVFRVIQFARFYVEKEIGFLPEYKTLTAEQINRLNFGPVTKSMIFIENAVALMEHMRYDEALACIGEAAEGSTGVNCFVDFFMLCQKAQIFEELGELNRSLECYRQADEKFKSPSMMSMLGFNFYIGITGVYLRRMEFDKARESLEKANAAAVEKRCMSAVIEMTYTYHLAEINFLSGMAEEGAAYVDCILRVNPEFNPITIGRLINELDCEDMLKPELADRFLEACSNAENYRQQPSMRLTYARIIYKKGKIKEGLDAVEEIMAFSRRHKNKLRLVEADILKLYMLANSGQTGDNKREMMNLLREAVYYAHENRLLMPFYLDRRAVLPLLTELMELPETKRALSPGEADFVREAAVICGYTAPVSGQELLSSRELEVLAELAKGLTNREIAEKLCISQATVKTHLLSIFCKLNVSTRMMAAEEGKKRGII